MYVNGTGKRRIAVLVVAALVFSLALSLPAFASSGSSSSKGKLVRGVGVTSDMVVDTGETGATSSKGKLNISKAKVAVIKTQAYKGRAVKPSPKVTYDGKVLRRGTDYTLSYVKNKKAGTAYAIITGKGKYKGMKTVSFEIAKSSLSSATLKCKASKEYTGEQIKPKVKVRFAGKKLKRGKDYTVSYRNNTKVGIATVIVKGKGSFYGVKTTTFKIVKSTNDANASKSASAQKSTRSK